MAEDTQNTGTNSTLVGTVNDDTLVGTSGNDTVDGASGNDSLTGAGGSDLVRGGTGNDNLDSGDGNDLAAGDYVGQEWTLVDGKWVYNPGFVPGDPNNPRVAEGDGFDDLIVTGAGEDVLLGNLGDDTLFSGADEDIINAGTGDDLAHGGADNDVVNLEWGNDVGYGGLGADIVNGGRGDDVIYGDDGGVNLLSGSGSNETTLTPDQYSAAGNWDVQDHDGYRDLSQNVGTVDGAPYTVSFDLAANLNATNIGGTVEVLWNGEVVGTVDASSGVYETHSIEVTGDGDSSSLTFRVMDADVDTGPVIDTSGPIFSYEKTMTVGGEDVSVDAFAPGQAKLYQVIDGQLKVFDTASETYADAGAEARVIVNAIGFNVEDDMIYGIAKSTGVDALGNEITPSDVVMMDASGETYRIGDAKYADYVGDFDDSGNLWTFNSGVDRVSKIDVDNLDANGDPVVQEFNLPNDLFGGRIYDIAYNAAEDAFYAVQPPAANHENGAIVRIDVSNVENGGDPEISSVEITGTLFGDQMESGMVKGAYGAVFLDGDGNLYFGLNRGDHDLDGATASKGAIYQVHADFEAGQAYAEFKAESETTNKNDGAVDPRAVDPFAEVDTDSGVLIREPTITNNSGGNDDLRGGIGDDEIYGEFGSDKLHGGHGDDHLDGGVGHDKLIGGHGDDVMIGGEGNDSLRGGYGDDQAFGGTGRDYINMSKGDDFIDGGDGNDKIVGGEGSDTIIGGAGNDHMWGGAWTGDGSSDTFIVAQGSGKDMIHDFETDHDIVDLSAYGLEYSDLAGLMEDQGWATIIDLSALDGGQEGDKLILKSVSSDDLDENNFNL